MPALPKLPTDEQAVLGGVRDGLRSARFWRELITESDRQTLLGDIARVSLLLANDSRETFARDGDVSAGRTPTGIAQNAPCPRERLAFLHALWPRMEAALHQIEAVPPHVLMPSVRVVETHKARRISPQSLRIALQQGRDFVDVPYGAGGLLAQKLGGKIPRKIQESAVTPCLDTQANRAAKTVLVRFLRDAKTIAVRAADCEIPALAREAEQLARRIRSRITADPWRDLPLLPLRSDALRAALLPLVLRNSAPHRFLHDGFWNYTRGFCLNWNQPIFTLPADKMWLLYETWCVFTTAEILHDLGFRAKNNENEENAAAEWLAWGPQGLSCKLETNRPARLVLTHPERREKITLTYNRYFERGDAAKSGWHSRARALRPDITLEARGKLLVLDAKWKTYAQSGWEGSDIEQMHTYRDAIAHGPARNRVVSAWLLYAGSVHPETRRPVIAYPDAAPNAPFGNREVGALCLRPGVARTPLVSLIADFL